MTNAEIIFREGQRLAAEGLIGYTGRELHIPTQDGEIVVRETEPIHTFQHWKSQGYSVRKGEHAITRLTIWKHSVKPAENDGDPEVSRMFMKTAAFFAESQVEAIAQ